MELLVGCPVLQRAWIIPAWFAHLAVACDRAGLEPEFIFVGDPMTDAETFDAIEYHAFGRVHVVEQAEHRTEDIRDWNPQRFERMAFLRNILLREVRALAPDLFLSLDSDILIHPEALANMVRALDRFDAVGAKCYMSAGTACPSYGMLPYGGGLRRPDMSGGVVEVDVVMAAILMSPAAYAIDYGTHPQGEDVGWSIAARAAGLKLGWDNRCVSRHVMAQAELGLADARCG